MVGLKLELTDQVDVAIGYRPRFFAVGLQSNQRNCEVCVWKRGWKGQPVISYFLFFEWNAISSGILHGRNSLMLNILLISSLDLQYSAAAN